MLSGRALIMGLAVLCCSMAMHAQSQSTLFWDDFETQDFSAWSGATSSTPNSINSGAGTVVATRAHSGLNSFKAVLPASGGQAKLLENITPQTNLYVRFYLYVDSGWAQGSMVVLCTIGGGEQVWLRTSGGSLYLQDGNGFQGTHAISTGMWHSIEIHSQAGSGNGVATVWLDGMQDINATTLNMTGPFSVVYLGPDNADGTQAGSLYFDDFVISTTAIGAPPANITVRYPNTAARSAMPVDVVMFGQVASDTLVASVDSSAIYSKTGSMTAHERFSVTMSSLSAGDHTFQVQLQNSGGAPKATFTTTIHKFVNGTPTVSIDDNNSVYRNGQKVFAVTPFIDGSTEWSSVWLANSSVNVYGWVACYAANYAYTYSQFNNCMNTVSYPFIGPDTNWTGVSGYSASQFAANQPNAVSNATVYATNAGGNPNLFMWTWQDEPDLGPTPGNVAPSRMLALAQATHSNDGNHPVITNMTGYNNMPISRQNGWYYPIVPNTSEMMSDVFAFDTYPIIYQYQGWTVAGLVNNFEQGRRYTYDLVPWFAFIEAGICSTGTCSGYGPTAAQVNMESWLAVIHGMKGISWWGPAGWTTQDAAHWTALATFVSQVTGFDDAILSTTPLTVTSNQTAAGSRVDATVREDSSFVYVFAARLSEIGESGHPAISTNLTVSNFANNRTVTVAGENRTVNMANGVISDSFSPYAVHLYCVPKSATLPVPPCGTVAKAK